MNGGEHLLIRKLPTLRKLYEDAQLFEGGHVGAHDSGSDLPFHLLIFRDVVQGQRAVALVLTGESHIFQRP